MYSFKYRYRFYKLILSEGSFVDECVREWINILKMNPVIELNNYMTRCDDVELIFLFYFYYFL